MRPTVTYNTSLPAVKTESLRRSDGYIHRGEFCETQEPIVKAAKDKQADFLQNSGKAQRLKKPGAEKDELIWRT